MSTFKDRGFVMSKETQMVTKLLEGAAPVAPLTQQLEIMTVEDLAGYLKIKESTVYERLRFRATRDPYPLPAHRMIGGWRFLKHEIDAWLLSLPRAVPTRKRKYVRTKKAA
jgi:hypothetical protein